MASARSDIQRINVPFRLARDGRAVAAGETGEPQIRTPFGMLGYLDNPGLTDASFDRTNHEHAMAKRKRCASRALTA